MASLSQKSGVLGTRLAAHLLRRTSFNYSKQRVDEFATKTVNQAMALLMAPTPPLQVAEPIDPVTGLTWINNTSPPPINFNNTIYVMGYWFNELIQDPTINMKMAFFLHTNFATSWEVVTNSSMIYDHHQLLRLYGKGNFKELTKKVTLDNMMLIYLNNNQNTKTAPNENYARELLELFTIGKDPQTYTEDDVKAAARVLTGFLNAPRVAGQTTYIDPDTGLHAGRALFSRHNTDDKQFSAAFPDANGNPTLIAGATNQADMYRELDDFLDMIFNQIDTARHIVRKIYRQFVNTKIDAEVENDIIIPLANTFKNNNYELAPVLNRLFKSQHFYNEDGYGANNKIIGGMIKSPMEMLAHVIKFFDVQLPDQQTEGSLFYSTFTNGFLRNTFFSLTGFMLNAPDTVASYPAYHQSPQWDDSWFISSTIIPRYKVGAMFVTGRRVLVGGSLGAKMDSVGYIENALNISAPSDAVAVVDELIEYLFPEIPQQERSDYFLNDIFLEGLNVLNWFFEWDHYQTSGDDSDVRIPLDSLITALLGSPEFQTL